MASITIRNIGEDTKARLRVAAARAGQSMEERVRQLIINDVGNSPETPPQFGTWMHSLFQGIDTSDFVAPERDSLAEPVTFRE
jgi:antitoxin FitA